MRKLEKATVTKKQAEELQFVSVNWHDAYILHAWEKIKDLDDCPCNTYTAGFLIKKTKLHVIVAASVGSTFGLAAGITYIPIKMIKEMKYHGKVFKFNKGEGKSKSVS